MLKWLRKVTISEYTVRMLNKMRSLFLKHRWMTKS